MELLPGKRSVEKEGGKKPSIHYPVLRVHPSFFFPPACLRDLGIVCNFSLAPDFQCVFLIKF